MNNITDPKQTKFSSISSAESTFIHAPFAPTDIRRGEGVLAQITLRWESRKITHMAQVWRMSPMGVEFACDTADIAPGAEVDLELAIAHQICRLSGLVVTNVSYEGTKRLIGIRWASKPAPASQDAERRSEKRWTCANEFVPTGITPSPVRFNDFILFRIRDISQNGLQLITSLRNKLLVPGMQLESTFTFPMLGQAKVELIIKNVRIIREEGKDFLALGCEILKLDPIGREIIAQYLFQFGPTSSIEELSQNGFRVKSVDRIVEFSFVRTADEYREVLELRKLCYSLANKVPRDMPKEEMGDIFDAHSRILIARYRGTIVGSLRLMYPEVDTTTEHEQFTRFPSSFPRRDEIVDISRLSTHPSFRRSDLLMGLFRRVCLTAIQSKRRWIMGSATDKLLPVYEKIGMKATSVQYEHENLGGETHTIILGDTRSVILGLDVGPIIWNVLYADLVSYVSRQDLMVFGSLAQYRLALYRLLKPIAQFFYGRQVRRPRPRKKMPLKNHSHQLKSA